MGLLSNHRVASWTHAGAIADYEHACKKRINEIELYLVLAL